MHFPIDELLGFLTRNEGRLASARTARRETQLTSLVGSFLAACPGASKLHIARSSHNELIETPPTLLLDKQWGDGFGEHDVSLTTSGTDPSMIVEVKYARTVGGASGEQDQIVQPYCYFLNDVLYAALGVAASAPAPTQQVHAAVAFVENSIFSAIRADSVNPWTTLLPLGVTTPNDYIELRPRVASPNSGRGANKAWPDFRRPTSLERRHLSMAFTAGTSAKLIGIFEREDAALRISFNGAHRTLSIPGQQALHVLAIEPSGLALDSATGVHTQVATILQWLP